MNLKPKNVITNDLVNKIKYNKNLGKYKLKNCICITKHKLIDDLTLFMDKSPIFYPLKKGRRYFLQKKQKNQISSEDNDDQLNNYDDVLHYFENNNIHIDTLINELTIKKHNKNKILKVFGLLKGLIHRFENNHLFDVDVYTGILHNIVNSKCTLKDMIFVLGLINDSVDSILREEELPVFFKMINKACSSLTPKIILAIDDAYLEEKEKWHETYKHSASNILKGFITTLKKEKDIKEEEIKEVAQKVSGKELYYLSRLGFIENFMKTYNSNNVIQFLNQGNDIKQYDNKEAHDIYIRYLMYIMHNYGDILSDIDTTILKDISRVENSIIDPLLNHTFKQTIQKERIHYAKDTKGEVFFKFVPKNFISLRKMAMLGTCFANDIKGMGQENIIIGGLYTKNDKQIGSVICNIDVHTNSLTIIDFQIFNELVTDKDIAENFIKNTFDCLKNKANENGLTLFLHVKSNHSRHLVHNTLLREAIDTLYGPFDENLGIKYGKPIFISSRKYRYIKGISIDLLDNLSGLTKKNGISTVGNT